jgi:hypothetical protein
MGAVLAKVLALLEDPQNREIFVSAAKSRPLLGPSGLVLRRVAVFGSAFLPLMSLRFIHALGDLGIVELDHFLFFPFRPSSLATQQAFPALSSTVDSWAVLGDGMVDTIRGFAVAGTDAIPQAGSPREPSWSNGPIRLISCPNRRREVEVLKDEILCLLDRDPSLEPNKIAVLCPSPEEYRPYVEAVFPARKADGAPVAGSDGLPWHFLDTATAPTDFEGALAILLALPGGSLGRSVLSGLLGKEAFRNAMNLEADEVENILFWIESSGAREFFDAGHRSANGLAPIEDGTWDAMLHRIALGLVYGEDRECFSRVPLAMSTTMTPTVSKLITLLQGLSALARGPQWSGSKKVDTWATMVRQEFLGGGPVTMDDEGGTDLDGEVASSRLLKAHEKDPGPARLSAAISAMVQRVIDLEGAGNAQEKKGFLVDFPLFRTMLVEHLDSQVKGSGQALLSGVAIARFQPFRLIPFEHVFCLGMEEGAFPAAEERGSLYRFGADGTSAKNQRPQDLYSFLETLSTYRKSLTILYQGRDPGTRNKRLPAAPVAALLSAVPARINKFEASIHSFETPVLPPDLGDDWTAYQPETLCNSRTEAIYAAVDVISPTEEPCEYVANTPTGILVLDVRDVEDFFSKPLALHVRRHFGFRLKDEDDSLSDDVLAFAPDLFARYEIRSLVLSQIFAADEPDFSLPQGEFMAQLEETVKGRVLRYQRTGAVAGGHFLQESLRGFQDDAEGYHQVLKKEFKGSRIRSLAAYLGRKPALGLQTPTNLAFRIPPHQSARLGENLLVTGTLQPWFVALEEGKIKAITLADSGSTKPTASAKLKVLGRILVLAAWLKNYLPPEDLGPWTLGARFIYRTAGVYKLDEGNFQSVAWWAEKAEELIPHIRSVVANAVPLYPAMLDDKGLLASLEDATEAPSALADWFAQEGNLDSFKRGIPGNCPYYRMLFGGTLPPLAYKPEDAPGLVELMGMFSALVKEDKNDA